MNKQEVANKAIELFDAITEMFNESTPKRPLKEEAVIQYNTMLEQFGGIFTALGRQRFELERIRMEKRNA